MVANGQREVQAQHICSGWLRFDLPLQHSVEKTDGKKGLGQPRPQHLHIHSVGEVAQPSLKRLIHGVDPVQQSIRLTGKELVVPCNRMIQRGIGLDGLLRLLHRITGELKQGAEHLEIP